MADSPSRPPVPFNLTSLPPEVAREIAGYIRSAVFVPLSNNISALQRSCAVQLRASTSTLQHAHNTIPNVIEKTCEELIPIAEDLKDVYRQIDMLEALVARTGESVKGMEKRVEEVERRVRREDRDLREGRHVEVWAGIGPGETDKFVAKEWVQDGRLIERGKLEE